jgi:hypothetical protein
MAVFHFFYIFVAKTTNMSDLTAVEKQDSAPQQNEQQTINQLYQYAASLLINQKMYPEEAKDKLIAQGLSRESADVLIDTLEAQITKAKKERAHKNMLFGALWCIGGIVATAANIGFIFWGAIVFGGIQFFQGVADL